MGDDFWHESIPITGVPAVIRSSLDQRLAVIGNRVTVAPLSNSTFCSWETSPKLDLLTINRDSNYVKIPVNGIVLPAILKCSH